MSPPDEILSYEQLERDGLKFLIVTVELLLASFSAVRLAADRLAAGQYAELLGSLSQLSELEQLLHLPNALVEM